MPKAKATVAKLPVQLSAPLARTKNKTEKVVAKSAQYGGQTRERTRLVSAETKQAQVPVRLAFSEFFDLETAHLISDMQPIDRANLVLAGVPSSLL